MSAMRRKWLIRDKKTEAVLFGLRNDSRFKWLIGGRETYRKEMEGFLEELLSERFSTVQMRQEDTRIRFGFSGVRENILMECIDGNGWYLEQVPGFRRLMG